MVKLVFFKLCLAALLIASAARPQPPPVASPPPAAQDPPPESPEILKPTPRIRPECPIRLGGVYTMGLGGKSAPLEESDKRGVTLSEGNRRWIAANCDVIALNAVNLTPDIFPAIQKAQPLFTPLLHLYASTLYEQPDQRGNVGGWQPAMQNWTLRDANGKEIPHPDSGGHWMAFGHTEWAAHWRQRTLEMARRFGAHGAVAAELPAGNTFVGGSLSDPREFSRRAEATAAWLRAARAPGQFLLVPSALGFDALTGRPTPSPAPGAEQSQLVGRLWDEYHALMDGAWAEGWVFPYWQKEPLPERYWEIALDAADRYGRADQIFIAACAYRNLEELEYGLASYLLVWHRQGRVVFQPMPIVLGRRRDAGYSLAILRNEVESKSRYFNAPLGFSFQQRHLVPVSGGLAWRRAFLYGVVYVNSSDTRKMFVKLSGPMKRLSGETVRAVSLPPHRGVILLYPPRKPDKQSKLAYTLGARRG